MKRMAICAIIRNAEDELLIVEPTYRNDWLLPGGIIEENESPREACEREIKEELGIDIKISRILCIEYQSAHSSKTESVQFIADGGIISDYEISKIQIQQSELKSYQFLKIESTKNILNTLLSARLEFAFKALESNSTIYIEDKEILE
jgi:8-oxo-dGTP diphosphatase